MEEYSATLRRRALYVRVDLSSDRHSRLALRFGATAVPKARRTWAFPSIKSTHDRPVNFAITRSFIPRGERANSSRRFAPALPDC